MVDLINHGRTSYSLVDTPPNRAGPRRQDHAIHRTPLAGHNLAAGRCRCRTGPGQTSPEDSGGLPAWWLSRCAGPLGGRWPQGRLQPHRGGQQTRCRRPHRAEHGEKRQARWADRDRAAQRPDGAVSARLQKARLRRRQGFHPDLANRALSVRRGGRSCQWHQDRRRDDRQGQSTARHQQLRHARPGHLAALHGRADGAILGHPAQPCALPGRRSRQQRPAGWSHRLQVRCGQRNC